MMKKVLILGSTGMLGHQVYFQMKKDKCFELFNLSFRNKLNEDTILCDVTDTERLSKIIFDIKPDYIINCIGILIQGSNQNPKNSIFINAYLPHWLAAQAESFDGKLIHISTDCVFSGSKGGYVETDFRDADDVYGRGKALGEVVSEKHLTLRTSIIGPEIKLNGEGLFHWFMKQEGDVNGYLSAFWGGVTTLELSKVVIKAIDQNITGLINITNGDKISKHDLLIHFNEIFKRGLNINPFEGKKVDKSLVSLRSDFDFKIPSYKEMITEMDKWMHEHNYLYNHYKLV